MKKVAARRGEEAAADEEEEQEERKVCATDATGLDISPASARMETGLSAEAVGLSVTGVTE